MSEMITDHDISMAMAKVPSGSPVAKMLHQLLEMRRGVRLVVADHDFTKSYNSGIVALHVRDVRGRRL